MPLECSCGLRRRHLACSSYCPGYRITRRSGSREGDLDFRGTLAVWKDVPVGSQQIPLHFDLDTHASEEELATLLHLRERHCVIYQTLTHPANIDFASSHFALNLSRDAYIH